MSRHFCTVWSVWALLLPCAALAQSLTTPDLASAKAGLNFRVVIPATVQLTLGLDPSTATPTALVNGVGNVRRLTLVATAGAPSDRPVWAQTADESRPRDARNHPLSLGHALDLGTAGQPVTYTLVSP